MNDTGALKINTTGPEKRLLMKCVIPFTRNFRESLKKNILVWGN